MVDSVMLDCVLQSAQMMLNGAARDLISKTTEFHWEKRKCNNVTMRLFLASSDMKETGQEPQLF